MVKTRRENRMAEGTIVASTTDDLSAVNAAAQASRSELENGTAELHVEPEHKDDETPSSAGVGENDQHGGEEHLSGKAARRIEKLLGQRDNALHERDEALRELQEIRAQLAN
jgi:hypothetical protein